MADQPQASVPADKPADAPHYDRKGQLTLAGMRAKHAAGYSVQFNGGIIQPGHPLPSEAQIAAAGGDPADLDRARAANDAEIERLRAENQRLKAAATASQQPAPPTQAPASPAPAKAPGK